MEQKEFIINDFKLPYLEGDNGETYYPIQHIYHKLFDKYLTDGDKQCIKEDIAILQIIYDIKNNNAQFTQCLLYEDMQEFLRCKRFNLNTFSSLELDRYDSLMHYFKLDNFNKNKINICTKTCKSCNKEFPIHRKFYPMDKDLSEDICFECYKKIRQKNNNNIVLEDYIGKFESDEKMIEYLLNNTEVLIDLYYKHFKKHIKYFQQVINNKNISVLLINELYKSNIITKQNLTNKLLKKYKIHISIVGLDMYDVYLMLFKEDPYENPWNYPNFEYKSVDLEKAKYMFFNYVKQYNISLDNVYLLNYFDIIDKAGLRYYMGHNMLQFVMDLYDNKYIAYKFNISSSKYWKVKTNRIKALRDCIEFDLKIHVDKIPLYLTKQTLRQVSSTLYSVLHNGKYYKNIFEWVNEAYPNKFIEADFVINSRRMEFDSHEEMLIDEQLRNNLNNVIYNIRKDNNRNSININGMCPDWIVVGNNGCWLIEYFGLYVKHKNNKMTEDYINKTKVKLDKYKKIEESGYYKFLDLYPYDLKNNFQGLKDKINKIN